MYQIQSAYLISETSAIRTLVDFMNPFFHVSALEERCVKVKVMAQRAINYIVFLRCSEMYGGLILLLLNRIQTHEFEHYQNVIAIKADDTKIWSPVKAIQTILRT